MLCTILASLECTMSVHTVSTWQISYEAKVAWELKGHFLLREHGDLSFFLINFALAFILFTSKEL